MSGENPVSVESVVEKGVSEEPAAASTSELVEPAVESKDERTWSEEIEIAASQLVDQVKEWLAEGNVRRLVLRTPDNSFILEIPLVTGAVVGGVVTVFAFPLALLGAIASVITHVKVEIVRVDKPAQKE